MRKKILPIIMLCLLLTACGAAEEKEVKVSDEAVNTTIAENTQEQIFTAEDGLVVIQPSEPKHEKESTEAVTGVQEKQAEKTFTLPEDIQADKNVSIGRLRIEKIGIDMDVFETGDAMEDMKKGAAHFKDTSVWDGNIGLSAHDDGVKESVSFGKLNMLETGDKIKYNTSLGERNYEVFAIEIISDEDWSYLSRTEDNRITLITCVKGEPSKRLMIQAIAT